MGGNIMKDAFGVVALVAMTPLFTIQILGIVYDRKLKRMHAEEEHVLDSIADIVQNEEIKGWGALDVNGQEAGTGHAVDVDMDYAASPEWAESLENYMVAQNVTADNNYIDFDECEEA
jgi:hypothetical protein